MEVANRSVAITPAGNLKLIPTDDPNALSGALSNDLQKAFAESSAAGLVCLARLHGHEIPGDAAFWRGFAWRLFQAVRQLGEGGFGKWAAIPPPRDN